MRGRTAATCFLLGWLALGGVRPQPAWATELALGQQHLTITGQNTLAYTRRSLSGGSLATRAFGADRPYDEPGLTHRSQLQLRGEVLKDVHLSAHLASGGYAPSRSRFTLTFDGSDADVALGDLHVSLPGNEFIPFAKSLVGVKVDAQLDRGALTLFASRSKAPTKSESFFGRNASGPYYLSASPIVDGSEQVTVDGVGMRRGRDYTIDYQAGILLFQASRIIPPSSRVEVDYEHLSPGALTGSLLGVRGAIPLSHRLDLGATYLALKRPQAGGSATTSRQDYFTGNNTPGPFPLSYRPVVEDSERVRVEGIVQVRGLDYQMDNAAALVYFLRPVPMGAMITVDYDVATSQGAWGGDQAVAGFDLRYRPDPHLSLEGQFAATRGGASASDSGSAVGLRAAGTWPALSVQANWQTMSRGFAAIESVGAQEPRSGADLAIQYRPLPWARINASLSDHRRSTSDMFLAPTGGDRVRDRERTFALEIAPPRWPVVSLRSTRHRVAGTDEGGVRDDSGSDSLRAAYTGIDFGLTAEIQRTTTDSLLSGTGWGGYGGVGHWYAGWDGRGGAEDFVPYAATTTTRRLALWYRPGRRLRLTCDLAGNRIDSPNGEGDTSAHSRHLGLSYAPWRTVSVDLDFTSHGTGDSYSPDGWQVAESSTKARSVSLRYTPSARTALSLAHDIQRTQGGQIGASDSAGTTLSAYLLPCRWLNLNATYGIHRLRYLAASGASTNRILGVGARVGPWRRLTLDLGYHRMEGRNTGAFAAPSYGGASTPASGSCEQMLNSSLTARLACEAGRRHTAFVELERARALGYPSKSRRTATALGWEYAISRLVKVRLDWRHTVYRDLGDPRYNYVANRLNGEVRLNF